MNHNLKKMGGFFKGLIGECMFKLTNDKIIITRFFNKDKYLSIFGKYLSREQKEFLYTNWYSIDAIDILITQGTKNIILYEIKTRNRYHKWLPFKPKMTLETHKMYHYSRILGFIPKIATIWLYDDWNYKVEINDFEEKNYCIDKPKKYDRANF